ncbi:MAG: YkgJ family cysteine cluster protein [Termitinemataceae bacterium]|nr:MAG: YkgJ family cysteine cluster protein [Termitinemataceae bacterium]
MKGLFYEKGLRWQCIRCSDCCRHESGFVFLSQNDAETLARFLNMPFEYFIPTYCRWVALDNQIEMLSLKETSSNDCFFWKQGCSVYAARPAQCRTYPFWESFLVDEETWKNATASCPGVGTGRLYSREYIDECIAAERAAQPLTRRLR